MPDAAAGDIIETSADTARSNTTTSYVKVKEIKLGRGGQFRVKFALSNSTVVRLVHGRIYRNGVAFGTDQTTTSMSYVTKSEDISGWAAGDLLQLYLKAGTVSDYCNGKELRIYTLTPLFNKVITD